MTSLDNAAASPEPLTPVAVSATRLVVLRWGRMWRFIALAGVLALWAQSELEGLGWSWSRSAGDPPIHWRVVSQQGRLFVQGLSLPLSPLIAPQVAGFRRVPPAPFLVGTGSREGAVLVPLGGVRVPFSLPSPLGFSLFAQSELTVSQIDKTYWSSSWYEVSINHWLIALLLISPELTQAARWLKKRVRPFLRNSTQRFQDWMSGRPIDMGAG